MTNTTETTTRTIAVGEKFLFKMTKTRGRPFIGEVVKRAGMFTMMKTGNGEIVRVKTNLIGRPYEFTPYNTAKRRAAEAE